MGHIILKGIRVTSNHGVYPGEEKIERIYEINLSIKLNLEKACALDDFSSTINYVELDNIIRKEMKIRSQLVEHVAKRIIDSIKKAFSFIEKIKIKVCKLNPPIEGYIEKMCVKLEE